MGAEHYIGLGGGKAAFGPVGGNRRHGADLGVTEPPPPSPWPQGRTQMMEVATCRREAGVRDVAIHTLIDDIAAQWRTAGTWWVDAATLQRTLGVSPQDYYQSTYATDLSGDRMVTLEAANDRLDASSVGVLAALVEHLAGPAAVAELVVAGIYHPHEQQAELMAALMDRVASLIGRHQFQEQTYRAMLHDRRNVERARDTYIDHFFDLAAARRLAAAAYCRERAFALPDLALATAEGLLGLLFERHVLTSESLFARLFPRFAAAERAEGFARERGAARGAEPHVDRAGEESQARRVMGLRRGRLTLDELRDSIESVHATIAPNLQPLA